MVYFNVTQGKILFYLLPGAFLYQSVGFWNVLGGSAVQYVLLKHNLLCLYCLLCLYRKCFNLVSEKYNNSKQTAGLSFQVCNAYRDITMKKANNLLGDQRHPHASSSGRRYCPPVFTKNRSLDYYTSHALPNTWGPLFSHRWWPRLLVLFLVSEPA